MAMKGFDALFDAPLNSLLPKPLKLAFLGGRLTVRLWTLDPPIGVRIPASQCELALAFKGVSRSVESASPFSFPLLFANSLPVFQSSPSSLLVAACCMVGRTWL